MAVTVTSHVFASEEGVDATAQRLAQLLDLTFTPHDSSYRGGAYLVAGHVGGEEIIVQRNEDLDEPAEPVDAPTIVYVESTLRPVEVESAAMALGLQLIRRERWSKT